MTVNCDPICKTLNIYAFCISRNTNLNIQATVTTVYVEIFKYNNFQIFRKSQAIFENLISKYFGGFKMAMWKYLKYWRHPLTMQEMLPPFFKNSLWKVAQNTCSMLDCRNSLQIMYVTNLALTMKLFAMYTTPNIFINMTSMYN